MTLVSRDMRRSCCMDLILSFRFLMVSAYDGSLATGNAKRTQTARRSYLLIYKFLELRDPQLKLLVLLSKAVFLRTGGEYFCNQGERGARGGGRNDHGEIKKKKKIPSAARASSVRDISNASCSSRTFTFCAKYISNED